MTFLIKLSNKHCNIGAIGADIVVNKLDAVPFLVNIMTESPIDEGITNTGFNLLKLLSEIKTLLLRLERLEALPCIVLESTLMLASNAKPSRPFLLSCILNSNDGYVH
jgi:hypothetical protein